MNVKMTSLTLAIGAAFVATAGLAPMAHAADNPFGMQKLNAGYQVAQAKTGDKEMAPRKKVSKKKAGKKTSKKMAEQKMAEPKMADKQMEGKCGEGKCGGSMKQASRK